MEQGLKNIKALTFKKNPAVMRIQAGAGGRSCCWKISSNGSVAACTVNGQEVEDVQTRREDFSLG